MIVWENRELFFGNVDFHHTIRGEGLYGVSVTQQL